jgi:hypothetical protein
VCRREKTPMFDDEISEARSQDIDRGKKSVRNLQRKRMRLNRMLLKAFDDRDRERYSELLIDLGQPSGSKGYERAMKFFDESPR